VYRAKPNVPFVLALVVAVADRGTQLFLPGGFSSKAGPIKHRLVFVVLIWRISAQKPAAPRSANDIYRPVGNSCLIIFSGRWDSGYNPRLNGLISYLENSRRRLYTI